MTVYEAFETFKTRFLRDKKSIFHDGDSDILTNENVIFLYENFNKNTIEGNEDNFDEKISRQLEHSNNQQKELFAHIIWLWFIFASDMKLTGKVQSIKKWLGDDWINNGIIPINGIGNTGQYHKTNKPTEIAYLISFLKELLTNDVQSNYVELTKNLGDRASINGSDKKVAMYNILLHLFDPENFERIASYGHKEKIVSFFESYFLYLSYPEDADIDIKLKLIRESCLKDDKFKNLSVSWDGVQKFDFYHSEIEQLWKSDIVLEAKNMILHGAPGTGKTYSVENSIKKRLEFNSSQTVDNQFTLVQFHSSYGYEDFIDGIKPSGFDNNGVLKLELVNGEFKKVCIEAFKELVKASNESRQPHKFYFVADEINRAELSRVFGELLLCIEDDKRLRFENKKLVGTLVKTQNSNVWQKEHSVVTLNKSGQISDNGEFYFGVPENLYFIGTMNDIDRSVDSFDLALRRRFFWKHFECDYDVIRQNYGSNPKVDEYINVCKKLNDHIISEKGFNLGESYQLGHSYFLKPLKINSEQLEKIWMSNIAPLLKEYLRSEYSEKDIKTHLHKAKALFRV